MVINAFNSGADSYMTDFEDSNSPVWDNQISGQINLRDAIRKTISLEQNGKSYKLNDKVATLVVRPRGWHLDEKHVTIDGKRISGGIFDFALFLFHNAKEQLARGAGPYFYLPKMESHLEARLWNDIFVMAQNEIGLPQGTIKATVLIETITAAFEMDEILYELREHSAGLNAGRWDYIFSCIKKFKNDKEYERIVGLIARFMNEIAITLEVAPKEYEPLFCEHEWEGKPVLDGEAWAWGFNLGMSLRAEAWEPINSSNIAPLMRPIYLLGAEEIDEEEIVLVDNPVKCHKLTIEIESAIPEIHKFWLPHRKSAVKNRTARRTENRPQ